MRQSLRRSSGVAPILGAVCVLSLAQAACSSSSGVGVNEPSRDGAPDDAAVTDAAPADAGDATLSDAGGSLDATTSDAGTNSLDGAGDAPIDAGSDGATASDVTGCALDEFAESTELRCTGLYSDWGQRTVASNVTEYDPGLHLWSDGAVKTRWVYLPPGKTIDTSNMDEWTFPVGTKFWKQFVVGGVFVETRLIHKTAPAVWYLTTYRWSADASTATELTTGAVDVNDAGYEIPSQAKCTECHQGRLDDVLGFEAVSLSSPGATGLPIGTLEARSLLSDPPDAAITIPGTPTEVAALGYLHSNCGMVCHNADNGFARSTGFFMRLNVADLASVETTDTYKTGWNQATQVFHTMPTRIASCSTASSCVFYRMSRRDGENEAGTGIQMPPIDTHQIDPNGIALVSAWISEGCDAGSTDASADASTDDSAPGD